MDELICNNTRLDLNGETPFPLSLSIMDLLDPSKRKRNSSKRITFEGTQSNCAFFASAFSIHITGTTVSFDSTAKATCQYYKNSVLLIPDGVLRLIEVQVNGDRITFVTEIYGESVDVFLLLNEINVADLDWSEYDHTLSRANIIASWSTPSGTGYRYPLIERGNARVGTTIWNTTDLVPYVHFVEVLTKMYAYLGFTLDSDFLDSTRAKNILFGYGGGDLISQSISPADVAERIVEITTGVLTVAPNNMSYQSNTSPAWGGYGGLPLPQTVTTNYTFQNKILLSPIFTSVEVNDDLDQYSGGRTTIARSGNYNIALAGKFGIELTGGNDFLVFSDVRISIIKNGSNLFEPSPQTSWLTNLTPTTWEFDFSINNNFYFQSGDEITILFNPGYARYSRPVETAFIPVVQNISTLVNVTLDITSIDSSVTDGSTVNVSRFLPAMKCSDFLLGAIRQFYITTTDPDRNGVIKFEPLIDFYQPTSVFEDVSTLVDHSKTILIKPSANEFQKNHLFTYKDNKDTDNVNYFELYGKKYGDYNFAQGSFYSKGDNKIDLPWSSIVPYEISAGSGILVPRFIIIDNNGGVKGNKGNPRIMMWNGLKPGSWTFRNTDNTESFQVLTTYPCVHHFDNWTNPTFDLNFQLVDRVWYTATVVTLINCFTEYYSTFYNEMTSPLGRLVDLYLKWNEYNVKDRDFSKLLMWDGALFRLNNISDFDSDKATSCKVQLIKVLEARKRASNGVTVLQPGLVDFDAGLANGGDDSVDDDAPVVLGGIKGGLQINSSILNG